MVAAPTPSSPTPLTTISRLDAVLGGGYTPLPARVMRSGLQPSTKLVYTALCDWFKVSEQHGKDYVWPSHEQLAAATDLGLHTIGRAISELKNHHLLAQQTHGRGHPCTYQLIAEEQWTLPPATHAKKEDGGAHAKKEDGAACGALRAVPSSQNGVSRSAKKEDPLRNNHTKENHTKEPHPERVVALTPAREATSSPQLDRTVAVGWSAAADETDQLRGLLGLDGPEQDTRWAQCWALLEPPYRRFRLDVQDPGQLGDIRTLVNQLRELVLRAGVPQEDLVRWQIWQMGDPWWLTARYKYNPLRVWEQSWQIWKREGQPSTFVPVAQKGRPGPGASPGDDASVYGRGARVAHQVTAAQEELACCEWCGRSVGEQHLTSRCGQEGYVQGPQDRVLPQLAYAALHEPGLRRLL